MERIRYLKQEEKQKTRSMYEEIFSEDSASFIDYYYDWKIRDNQIVIMESEEKEVEVMIHLNPYEIEWNGKVVSADYIVAVATRPDCRKQGKMQRVVQQLLQDMKKAQCPFTFLLPANPAYYYGQGFLFFPEEQNKTENFLKAAENFQFLSIPAKEEDAKMLAQTANEILQEQYHMFIRRDSAYYQRLFHEVSCEGGEVLILRHGVQVIGILAYGREEKQAEIKELILEDNWKEESEEICNQVFGKFVWSKNPMQMMVRIADLQALQGFLKSTVPYSLKVRVKDDMIEENNGCWEIQKNSQGGSVKKIKEYEAEQVMDIQQLTEEIFKDVSVFIREWV